MSQQLICSVAEWTYFICAVTKVSKHNMRCKTHKPLSNFFQMRNRNDGLGWLKC